ncbi:putative magnesium transporter [Forsythia ovata]|uniref:Magnesium transporter n=1 Tax=Forsythia ovata TaxID=205694 RepID=A0ABD1SJG9_9LAMI
MKLDLEGESATTAPRKPKNGAISLSLNFDDIFPGKKRSREGWNSDSVSSFFALSPKFLSKSGRVMYIANLIGFRLALASSAFIGYNFIVKKKGLQRAGTSSCRATPAEKLQALLLVEHVMSIVGEE